MRNDTVETGCMETERMQRRWMKGHMSHVLAVGGWKPYC